METTTLRIIRVKNMSDILSLQHDTYLAPSLFKVARLNENEYAYYAKDEQGAIRAERRIRQLADKENNHPTIHTVENARGRRCQALIIPARQYLRPGTDYSVVG